jgi:hypothetical protein
MNPPNGRYPYIPPLFENEYALFAMQMFHRLCVEYNGIVEDEFFQMIEQIYAEYKGWA